MTSDVTVTGFTIIPCFGFCFYVIYFYTFPFSLSLVQSYVAILSRVSLFDVCFESEATHPWAVNFCTHRPPLLLPSIITISTLHVCILPFLTCYPPFFVGRQFIILMLVFYICVCIRGSEHCLRMTPNQFLYWMYICFCWLYVTGGKLHVLCWSLWSKWRPPVHVCFFLVI